MSDKTTVDRNSYRHDYGLLATENTILGNKLARLQSQPDLEAKCFDLESSLDQSRAECLGLEKSLERSKRLRQDEDSERRALSTQARLAKRKLSGVKTMLMLELECLKVDHREELDLVRKQRDDARATLPTNSHRLHEELKAKDDEMTLLRANLKAQEIKSGVQSKGSFLRRERLNLDKNS